MNKISRSVTKWTRACDRRLARLVCYFYHANDYRQCCRVGKHGSAFVDWVCSKTQILLETLKTLNQFRVNFCVFSGGRALVPKSWMCKKQASVSHSSTESGDISLDVVMRMDGLSALDYQGAAGNCLRNSDTKLKKKGNQAVDQFSDVDHVVTNASSSQCEAQLHIFEECEAVIKIIIEGISPTMRHVSRTHRNALNW